VASTVPDRPHRVDHPTRRQLVAAGNLRIARAASTQLHAFQPQRRPGCAVDRPIDTPTAKQGGIGGVDDRINPLPGDVAALDAQSRVHG